MNHTSFLELNDNVQDDIKLNEYISLIKRKLWNKIVYSSPDLRSIFPSHLSSRFSNFLQWMKDKNKNYDWRLFIYTLNYIYKDNLSLNLMLSLLINAANEWFLDDISTNHYLFLYSDNKEQRGILYKKPGKYGLKAELKICSCLNFTNNDFVEGEVYFFAGNELPRLKDNLKRVE